MQCNLGLRPQFLQNAITCFGCEHANIAVSMKLSTARQILYPILTIIFICIMSLRLLENPNRRREEPLSMRISSSVAAQWRCVAVSFLLIGAFANLFLEAGGNLYNLRHPVCFYAAIVYVVAANAFVANLLDLGLGGEFASISLTADIGVLAVGLIGQVYELCLGLYTEWGPACRRIGAAFLLV